MVILLFLIVLMITNNDGTARPLSDGDLNIVTNGLDDNMDGMIYKMPTKLKKGTTIQINGTLNTSDEMFRVILGNSDNDTEYCKINVNFATGDITVAPAIKGYDYESYELQLEEGVASNFSLRIIVRTNGNGNNGNKKLAIYFQVNEGGESPQLICDIKNYENFSYIQILEGVSHVDSLEFEFGKNH